jgi:hypothetical protein
MLETFKTYILGEWQMIANAPVSFAMAVAATAVLVWLALSWAYGNIVSHQTAEIKLLERAKGEATAHPVSGQLVDRAELRLHFYGDERNPSLVSETNMWRWYYLRMIMRITEQPSGKEQAFVMPNLFVTFNNPVKVRTLEVSADFKLPKYEVKEFNNRFAIVVFDTELPVGTLTLTVR